LGERKKSDTGPLPLRLLIPGWYGTAAVIPERGGISKRINKEGEFLAALGRRPKSSLFLLFKSLCRFQIKGFQIKILDFNAASWFRLQLFRITGYMNERKGKNANEDQ
jgi:hypothetical protein